MALKKTIELENGTAGDYWRIERATCYNNASLVAEVKIELWLNLAVRREGTKSPIRSETVYIQLDSYSGDLLPSCYEKVKLLEQFTGAEDV